MASLFQKLPRFFDQFNLFEIEAKTLVCDLGFLSKLECFLHFSRLFLSLKVFKKLLNALFDVDLFDLYYFLNTGHLVKKPVLKQI